MYVFGEKSGSEQKVPRIPGWFRIFRDWATGRSDFIMASARRERGFFRLIFWFYAYSTEWKSMLHPLQTKGKSTGCDRLRRWCWPWSWIKIKMERCLAKWFHELSFFRDLQCFLIYFIDFYRSVWFKIQNACLRWLKCRPFQNSSWAVSTSMPDSEFAKCCPSWRVGFLVCLCNSKSWPIKRKHG